MFQMFNVRATGARRRRVGQRKSFIEPLEQRVCLSGTIVVQNDPDLIAIADLGGDRKADLITAMNDSAWQTAVVAIRAGLGDGRFGAATSFKVNSLVSDVVAGDFQQGRRRDADEAVLISPQSNAATGQFSIVAHLVIESARGRSVRSTTLVNETAAPSYLDRWLAADVNNDGLDDLVRVTAAGVTAFAADGVGGFAPLGPGSTPFAAVTGTNSGSFAAGDFNADGRADLAGNFGGLVHVALGAGDGSFADAQFVFLSCGLIQAMGAGDVDGNGVDDLLVTFGDGFLMTSFGAATNPFLTQVFGSTQSVPNVQRLIVVDIDGNGLGDVFGQRIGKTEHVLLSALGNGAGEFNSTGFVVNLLA